MRKFFYIILAILFLFGVLGTILLMNPSSSVIVVGGIDCKMSPPRIITGTDTFKLPRKGREDGSMPVLFKDGSRELWNVSTFCENEAFQANVVGKTFQIEYSFFRTIQSWEEQ